MQSPSFHQFSIARLDNPEQIHFEQFKGKKVLIVNVASECGFTRQYEDLQAFHQQYGDKVVVVGFPCNQFGGQEPGTEKEIATFCKRNFGVTFPLTTKIDVKGKNAHPIYQWLTTQSLNGVGDYKVSWNFNKFLIDENGKLIGYFPSSVNPFDDQIISKL